MKFVIQLDEDVDPEGTFVKEVFWEGHVRGPEVTFNHDRVPRHEGAMTFTQAHQAKAVAALLNAYLEGTYVVKRLSVKTILEDVE